MVSIVIYPNLHFVSLHEFLFYIPKIILSFSEYISLSVAADNNYFN